MYWRAGFQRIWLSVCEIGVLATLSCAVEHEGMSEHQVRIVYRMHVLLSGILSRSEAEVQAGQHSVQDMPKQSESPSSAGWLKQQT